MDTVSKRKRSEVMRLIKSANSKLELFFRKELNRKGYKYKTNVSKLLGKPDIVFSGKRIVVFLDSCFWHGCEKHCRMPSANRSYWMQKIKKNGVRDKKWDRAYKKMGWRVLRFWEHDIKKQPQKAIEKVAKALYGRGNFYKLWHQLH